MKILVLNGPNLNLIGSRQPEIYGKRSFDDYFAELRSNFSGIALFQSNHEGELIDRLQEAPGHYDAVVINPGALAHTSIALADAIRSISIPVVEVHLSNIYARETYRRHSYTAEACRAVLSGFGLEGYRYAVLYLTNELLP